MFLPVLADVASIIAYQRSHKGGGTGDEQSTPTWDFGFRTHPITGERQFHNGVDLPAVKGTPIYSPLDGVIKKMATSDLSGNYLQVIHNDPEFPEIAETRYAHLDSFNPTLLEGMTIKAGDLLGFVGETGRATGPHLHFIVYEKQAHQEADRVRHECDPLPYIEGKKNSLMGGSILGAMIAGATLLYLYYSKH